ncbi:MAG: hypothetical protein ACI82Q_002722, partial [Nonlabens sp.]
LRRLDAYIINEELRMNSLVSFNKNTFHPITQSPNHPITQSPPQQLQIFQKQHSCAEHQAIHLLSLVQPNARSAYRLSKV